MKKTIALLLATILLLTLMDSAQAGGDPAKCPHTRCDWKVITPATYEHGGVSWWVCLDCGKALYFKNTPQLVRPSHGYHGPTQHDHDCGHDHP